MQKHDLARNLLAQEPGRENRHANAASIPNVATEAQRGNASLFCITSADGESFTIVAKGRVAWALDRLIEAGPKGCTPLSEPGPRWSAYVHVLREMGVSIETLQERHGGEFRGRHGRYVLRCDVRTAAA